MLLLGFCAACAVLLLTLGFVLARFDGTADLPAECAVVFGATVHAVFDKEGRVVGSEPGPGIWRRVQTAVDLYRQKQVSKLFLTGGRGEGMQRSEAQVMRELAEEEGVASSDIVIEERATSTLENIQMIRPHMADCRSVVGISDRYHLARIELLARLQGWSEMQTYPSHWRPTWPFEVRSVIREIGGILYYGLAGTVDVVGF